MQTSFSPAAKIILEDAVNLLTIVQNGGSTSAIKFAGIRLAAVEVLKGNEKEAIIIYRSATDRDLSTTFFCDVKGCTGSRANGERFCAAHKGHDLDVYGMDSVTRGEIATGTE